MRSALVAVAALTIPVVGCTKLASLHGHPPVERKAPSIPDTVVSPGIVEPWGAQVELSAREAGWIASILVNEGDRVERDRVLATLDEAGQVHAVEQAKADLAEAAAVLARVENGTTREELQQAQAEYDAATARDAFARATATRVTQLRTEGVVSENELDRVLADARAQSAAVERASARLLELKRGDRAEVRQAAGARMAAARARVDVAAASLNRRRVVAASAGTILLSRFHAGEFYTPGAGPLFVLGDMTRLQVRLEVDEIDAAVPSPGTDCAIYSDAGVRLAEGTVVRLAPKMGRRALPLESPTARADVRVREVFVQVPSASALIPNQRVWGHIARGAQAIYRPSRRTAQ